MNIGCDKPQKIPKRSLRTLTDKSVKIGKEVMKEKEKHRLAYEYYFILGGFASKRSKKEATKKLDILRGSNFYKQFICLCGKRSLLKVAIKFNVSRTAVNNWYKAFNWEARARSRDIEIQRGVILRGIKNSHKSP